MKLSSFIWGVSLASVPMFIPSSVAIIDLALAPRTGAQNGMHARLLSRNYHSPERFIRIARQDSNSSSSDLAVASSTYLSASSKTANVSWTSSSTFSLPPSVTHSSPALQTSTTNSSGSGSGSASSTDLLVLNFANVLEQLETNLYLQGLSQFTLEEMIKVGLSVEQGQIIIESLTTIAKDEATHSTVLESTITALGGPVSSPCQFNFNAALSDPLTFLATARAVELIGISAYEGAATLIQSKSVLLAALSIHAVEARHQTSLNVFSAGNFIPQAFDMALTPQQVLALAGGFLEGCSAQDLGVTTNNPLSIRNKNTGSTSFQVGDQLQFTSDIQADANSLFCAMLVGGANETINLPLHGCTIPDGINGPVYVFLTSSSAPIAADINVQDASTILAGPGLIFVDALTTLLQEVFVIGASHDRNSHGNGHNDNGTKQNNGNNDTDGMKDNSGNGHSNGKHSSEEKGQHNIMPSADLGAVIIFAQASASSGNATAYWRQNPIAVQAQIGSGASIVGWSNHVVSV